MLGDSLLLALATSGALRKTPQTYRNLEPGSRAGSRLPVSLFPELWGLLDKLLEGGPADATWSVGILHGIGGLKFLRLCCRCGSCATVCTLAATS